MPAPPTILSWALVALVAVLAFGLLVVVHEAGHFAMARWCGMRVERFSVGYGPALWSRRRGETEWCISAIPFGGYVKIAGMAPGEEIDPADRSAYANQPAWRRFLVILSGPAMNYLAAVALAAGLIASFGFREADPRPIAGEIAAASAAARAGLRAGDEVLSIGGRPVDSWMALVAAVRAHPGQQVEIVVRRSGAPEPIRLTARPDDMNGVGRLGVAPSSVAVRAGPGRALAWASVSPTRRRPRSWAGWARCSRASSERSCAGPSASPRRWRRARRRVPRLFSRWSGSSPSFSPCSTCSPSRRSTEVGSSF